MMRTITSVIKWLAILYVIYSMWQTMLILLCCTLMFAFATKPTSKSFEKFFKNYVNEMLLDERQSKKWSFRLLLGTVSKLVDREFKDFVFFRVVCINRSFPRYFIGAFQNWFEIDISD